MSQAEHRYNTLIAAGYAASGTSAAVDLLLELDGVFECGVEPRIIADPDGIMSLENALTRSWTPYQSDLAIRRFQDLVARLTRRSSTGYYSHDLSHAFGPRFNELTDRYLDQIVKVAYSGLWMGIKDLRQFWAQRLNRRLGLNLCSASKRIYIGCQRDEFLRHTRRYLRALLDSWVPETGVDLVILDEGYTSMNQQRALDYFEASKMIVVRRDPRDVFVESHGHWFFIPQDASDFVTWFRLLMNQAEANPPNDRVLHVQFEDLILDYEATVPRILEFVGLSSDRHTRKQTKLKPNESARNIGRWRSYQDRETITLIENSLSEYCYDRH